MLYKLIFSLALLCAVGSAELHRVQKISHLSGDPLIQAACKGVGDDVVDCISTLQTAPPQAKADSNSLAIFALSYVENHAENITDGIKKINAMPDVAPLLQSALADCMDQYKSLDDLIEDATLSLSSKSYDDALKFVMASLTSLDVCESRIKDSDFEEKVAKKTGPEIDMATGLYKYTVLHRKILFAALNILSID